MTTSIVTGGGGFLGRHLVAALLAKGQTVVVLDNFVTGDLGQTMALHPHYILSLDVCEPWDLSEIVTDLELDDVDYVYHLASYASPAAYQARPLDTLRVGSIGTERALDFAALHGARFLLASTSEVYGDPLEHPQKETYWGNVNPVGPRAMYDESKRYAEALVTTFREAYGTNTAIARIFNTYGPGMNPHDGRVVSNLVRQFLASEDFTIYGDGQQTRSFCYVDDTIRGLIALAESAEHGPINIGNEHEFTINELAEALQKIADDERPGDLYKSYITRRHLSALVDDPKQRCPDISKAYELIDWAPQVSLKTGLSRMIAYERARQ